MYYYNQPESEPLIPGKKIVEGELYLQGYADAVHSRPHAKHKSKKARDAYERGWEAGQAAKRDAKP